MIFILDKSMNIRDSLSNSGEISHITPFFDDIYTSYLETGAETYQFSTLANTKESQHLIVGNHIAFQYEDEYKLFTITEIEETHDENFIKTVYCEMAGLKLINKVIRPMSFSSTNLRKFLEEILSDTDWNIGALDIGLNNVCDIEIKDYTNAYSLLQTHIRESYKGEIHFTVKFEGSKATKYINVYSNRGQFDGFRFSYDSNLTSITRTINFDDLATALIGVGNNGLTFKEIETEDKPLNQDFITDESAYLLWNDNGSHILGYEKFDTDSPQELLKLTREKLKERCQPKIKYELNPELLGETVKIGDTVYVIDNEFNPPIHLSARINQLSISLTDKSNNSCVLSNFTEITSNITEEMRQIASQLEGYVDGQFPIGGDKIQDGAIDGDKLANGQIIQGTHIFANSIQADHIQAETIDTEHLKADSIDAEKIQANSITSNHIQSNTIETEHLKANIIQSEHIQSNTIDANHIISNSINSGHIQTGSITAGSGIIADGAIGNAQISSIDAGKIEAGTIDTSKVTVQGSNGHLRIKGNRLQVFNGTGNQAKERVSVGDVNGDGTVYGLRVRGADGKTILLDENGVTSEGITDGSITNDKISDNAEIDGAKLNINSVVSCINEDGTEVIKGTKISVNGTNLETKLSSIETTQSTQGSTISQHSSKILANEKAIALKVDSQTYTTDKNNMTTQLNKNTSAINVLQDEIALKVEQTDITNAINGVQVGGRNLALKTNQGVIGWGWGLQTGGKTITEIVENGIKCCKMVRDNVESTGWSYISFNQINRNKYLPSKKYTISFDVKSSIVTSFYIGLKEGSSLNPLCSDVKTGNTVANKWTRLSATITTKETLPASTSQILYLNSMNSNVGVSYIFRNLIIVEGNKATDWTPAPEDITSEIDTKINTAKAEIKVTTDAITQNVSNLTQTVSNKADGSTVSTLSNKVGSLETSVNGISGKVSSLETSNTTLNNKVNTAQNTANSNKNNISSLQTEVSTVKNNVASLDVTTNGISQKVSSLQSTTTTLTSKVNTAQSTADSVGSKLNNLQIGARNLLKGTSSELKSVTFGGWDYYFPNNLTSWRVGGQLTGRVYIKPTNQEASCMLHVRYTDSTYSQYRGNVIKAGTEGYSTVTITVNPPSGKTVSHIQFSIRHSASNTPSDVVYYKEAKVESGSKATDWSPAPEDVSQDATNKSNQALTDAKNYTNTQITTVNNKVASIQTDLSGITSRVTNTENSISTINGNVTSLTNRVTTAESKITESAITNTVKKNFYTKSETESAITSKGYQTSSQVQQTVNGLEVKVTQSGGYNLLKNGDSTGGLKYWGSNGGGISLHSSTKGQCFKTTFPSGITYTGGTEYPNWVKLKMNTEYVYSAYVCVDTTFNGSSTTPLHMHCTTDRSTGQTGLTVLDYDQKLTANTWKRIYIRFRTSSTADVWFRPFIYAGGSSTGNVYVKELGLYESKIPLAYSPHPSEIYDGITTIDKDGITVTSSNVKSKTSMTSSGFKITKTDTNEDVFKVNADGTLYMKGQITVTGGSVPTSNLSGTISSNQLNSTITNDISTAKNNASNAVSTANTAKSTADSAKTTATTANTNASTALNTANTVNKTVNDNKTNWTNAYNRVSQWAYGAVSGSTTINGGLIQTNTITTEKIAIGDFTNYSQLTPDNLMGKFTKTTDSSASNNPWLKMNTLTRDTTISRTYTCKGGEKFKVTCEMSTTVKGATSSGSTNIDYLNSNLCIYGKTKTGTNFYQCPAGKKNSSGQVENIITLPSDAVSFYVAIQLAGYPPFSGSFSVRNIVVTQISAELYAGITTIDKSGISVSNSGSNTHTQIDSSSFRVENNTGGTVAEFSQNSQIPNLNAGIISANEIYANNIVRKSTHVKNYYVAGGYGKDIEGAGGGWNNPCKTVQYVLDNYIEDILDYDVNIYVGESVPGWTCKSKSGKGVITFLIQDDCIVRDPLYLDNCTNRVIVNGTDAKKGTFMTGIVVTGCHNFDIGWVSFRGKNWAHSKGSCNVIIRDGSKGIVRCNDFNGCSFAIIVENNSELWVYGNRGSDITHYIGIGAYTTIYGMRSGSDVCPDFTGHYYADAGHANLYHIHDGANYSKTPSIGWSPSYTPSQKTQTWNFNKIWSDETLHGWSDRQELIQGYASTWNTGRWTGYMQMVDGMDAIRSAISGGTNLSGRIYVQRTSSSGNSTGSKLCLYASDGTLITNSTSINRSQGVWVSLSSSIIQKIQSGAITYFYLKADSNNTATYFKCESNAKIEITYTK